MRVMFALIRNTIQKIWHMLLNPIFFISNKLGFGIEKRFASKFWAGLSDYEIYFTDPVAIDRSKWLAEYVVKLLQPTSILEVGCNSGRNLRVIKDMLHIQCSGIDVNQNAVAYAKEKSPDIDFRHADATTWSEQGKSVDLILTMSVIDHISDDAISLLAKNLVATAKKYIVCVELWDGGEARRGPYKYSRDLRLLFEPLGVKTLKWEKSSGQYDVNSSVLYLYVGEVS
jgi:SAM-dependent methyltransferase